MPDLAAIRDAVAARKAMLAEQDTEEPSATAKAVARWCVKRPGPKRVYTAKHSGNLDLLRRTLDELDGWQEEKKDGQGYKCRLVWVASAGDGPKELLRHQMMNKFEGMASLADKAETERCLQRARDAGVPGLGPGAGSYFPRTWILPGGRGELVEYLKRKRLKGYQKHGTIIYKPASGMQGTGIMLIQHEGNLPTESGHVGRKAAVAQAYIPPLLYDGLKFDLRLYVVVTSVDPLEAYLHREGLARFCTEPYKTPSAKNLHRCYAHLTNYSLNKYNKEGYVLATDSQTDDSSNKSESSDDGRPFAGASKRPASHVIDELDVRGLIDGEEFWERTEDLAACVLRAMQPDLALRYRRNFPRERESLSDAAGPNRSAPDLDDRRCFHVIGLDVMIDEKAQPRLIEVNSSPSLALDQEVEVVNEETGESRVRKQVSPVDVAVKVRVMRSVLRLVGDRTLESDLRPICGGGKEEAEEWTLVDRCRRLFAAVQVDTSKGMSAAHYVRFCRNAGLLDLGAFAKADLEIMHTQLCAQQEWRANEPAQKLMRWTTFVRALQQLATRAFPDQDVGAAFGRLLDHVHRNADDGG
mmetsp:Transcript_13169/g.34961  ORF Transcript_13169/g.34961 Transcript_13169/m.34961 type:complete len:583 (-) Transcript_13169:37-1785(-)